MSLPPFLRHCNLRNGTSYHEAIFFHDDLGPAHALWWPSLLRANDNQNLTVLLFIPGNPGLVGFYAPFLQEIWDAAKFSGKHLAILAHGHLGHTPFKFESDQQISIKHNISLAAQVASATEAFDAIRSHFGAKCEILLVGHSVGAWITMQVMKSRGEDVAGAFLLFPTITHIKDTPNGRSLSMLFHPPLPAIVSRLSTALRLLPTRVLAFLFSDWPHDQLLVLQNFLHSSSCVYASLSMAHEEMLSITDLDIVLVDSFKDKLWVYLAEKDDWVGPHNKDTILRAFAPVEAEHHGSVKIVHGREDIPHAFCINHGKHLADQCFLWLTEGELL
ncbi:hypothetical protein PUNSTDRAFT_80998 [Punctularia strigosozonata HHB-11173 SS5]|uniref:uncharacterized protein n=1 Tax=Punctularia strigosozonata (strain HHB-11173) TaxID=741275 RepID=UPI000441868A|nr:uncharacterized protein PUNSTDRAFT_80998 [Punctularia strigosozonata HHB-11173 SS5]EIN14548.1 hypothetical protein PUNSTDRAFT_80998 [Punctularia strigosozonata HHB-11173 SS5]